MSAIKPPSFDFEDCFVDSRNTSFDLTGDYLSPKLFASPRRELPRPDISAFPWPTDMDRPVSSLSEWSEPSSSVSSPSFQRSSLSPSCYGDSPDEYYDHKIHQLPSSWPFFPSGADGVLLSVNDAGVSPQISPLMSSGINDLFYSPGSSLDEYPNLNVFDANFADVLDYSNSTMHSPSTISSSCSSSPSPNSFVSSCLPPHLPPSPEPPSVSQPHNPRRRFPCPIVGCDRRFTSQYTLKVHVEAHKPKPKVSFPCTLGCSERFSRQHDRLRHEVAKHGKICEFSCDDCGRFFSTKKTLGNHKCPMAQGETRWIHV